MKKETIKQAVAPYMAELTKMADRIYDLAEPGLEEVRSSAVLTDYLEKKGFQVTKGIAGLDTAFVAEWGTGKPILGFLAEYDALPGLGQKPVCTYQPLKTPGHGCGHNLLGTACAGAACALKEAMETSDLPGTIRVYGCPAEEIILGKIQMNQAGVFDDLDAAITWHPFDRNRVSYDIWQAQDMKNYKFYGVKAHASKHPELGRSALDAAELMNVGVNYLREHVADDVRIHYTYTNTDGPANIVPDHAATKLFYPLFQMGTHRRCVEPCGRLCPRSGDHDRNPGGDRARDEEQGDESEPDACRNILPCNGGSTCSGIYRRRTGICGEDQQGSRACQRRCLFYRAGTAGGGTGTARDRYGCVGCQPYSADRDAERGGNV